MSGSELIEEIQKIDELRVKLESEYDEIREEIWKRWKKMDEHLYQWKVKREAELAHLDRETEQMQKSA